tara:strand:+ start:4294 stop:4668 length:375 start_codon:yes stop_codon:yes gene_type:complete
MSIIKNTFIIILLGVFLSSCTSVRQLDIFKTEVERAPLNLPNPETPKLEDIKWVIITSENAEEVFAKLKEQGKDPVLFGLSDEDYELLAKNFAQIRAYMIKQGATLDQYRKYYESEESKPTKPE